MLFGRVNNSKKVTLESLGGPFCHNMAPRGVPRGFQNRSKNFKKYAFFRTRSWEAFGTPKSVQKWYQNGPKSFQTGSKFLCFSLVASSIFHYTFSRFSEIERASRSFAKTGLSFCCFLTLFFEVVSRTAFWP